MMRTDGSGNSSNISDSKKYTNNNDNNCHDTCIGSDRALGANSVR